MNRGGPILVKIDTMVLCTLCLMFSSFRLLEPTYTKVKQRSPDGEHTAYLYSDTFACTMMTSLLRGRAESDTAGTTEPVTSYEVWVRDASALSMRRLDTRRTVCNSHPAQPHLVWTGNSRSVRVLDENGSPLADDFTVSP